MIKENKIRILNIVPNMRAAGIETFIMNVYRNINRDKVQFDFLVHSSKKEFFDDEIEKLGGKIYRLSFKDDKNIFKYIRDLSNFFKEHKEYTIVHGHMQSMMPIYLLMAKMNGVQTRIAHSHNGSYEKTMKGFVLHVFSRFSKLFSTNNFACSDVAGKYLFGKSKYDILYNAIDVDKFIFNNQVRNEIRKSMNVENKIVLGHIGRFELQKNHQYLLKIMQQLKDQENVVLWLIGEGKLESDIKQLVKKGNLEQKIKFLGLRKDVNELYQAMDLFLLPSLYEGLPVVGIESQISGLNCIFSSKITSELKKNSKARYIGIAEGDLKKWSDAITELINKDDLSNRHVDIKDFECFNIKYIANYLEEKYQQYYRKGL